MLHAFDQLMQLVHHIDVLNSRRDLIFLFVAHLPDDVPEVLP